MANPTKILEYDLDLDLQKLINDLKLINEDIKLANSESGKKISERLKEIEKRVVSLNTNQLEAGNFNEIFAYDLDGNVTRQEVTGDNPSVTIYNYKEDGSGELIDSIKTFTNEANDSVEILKTYAYTDGNITGIETNTEITPAV